MMLRALVRQNQTWRPGTRGGKPGPCALAFQIGGLVRRDRAKRKKPIPNPEPTLGEPPRRRLPKSMIHDRDPKSFTFAPFF